MLPATDSVSKPILTTQLAPLQSLNDGSKGKFDVKKDGGEKNSSKVPAISKDKIAFLQRDHDRPML